METAVTAPPTSSTNTSSSASRSPKRSALSEFSAKDLAYLQKSLDRDFQNFWDIRRYGNHLGTEIKCALCPWRPPKQGASEDFVWYSYRKYRALCNHVFTGHCRQAGLAYRRIVAQQKRLDKKQHKAA